MKTRGILKGFLPLLFGGMAIVASIWWFISAPNKGVKELPVIQGHREGCVVCHLPMTGFNSAHDPKAIGCASCHLGNTFTMDKGQAHKGMVLVPGNLAQVKRTCGTSKCHPLLAHRVRDTLMATGRGMVAVDRFVFGDTDSPIGGGNLSRLGSSPADDHLRKLCASCHLGKVKNNPRPIDALSRGGGCTACHLRYTKKAVDALEIYNHNRKVPDVHPSLSIEVTRDHCFGCHSRSGRISTSYEGWHEAEKYPEGVSHNPGYRILKDGRAFVRMSPDIHFQRGMDCIDCHTWQETMGDGKLHYHEEDQIEISCEDCHPLQRPDTITSSELREIDAKILKRRSVLQSIKRFVVASKTKGALLNVGLDAKGKLIVIGKNSGKIYHPKKPAPVCSNQISGHERLTCQSCHTPWAPNCIRCHTYYDRDAVALDHLSGRRVKGRWVEQRGGLLARQPALGIRFDGKKEIIDTFVPGMVITIDKSGFVRKQNGKRVRIFRRVFAPISAHTTAARGIDCKACHVNSVAMGLGEGLFSSKGGRLGKVKIRFRPLFPLRTEDGLPEDAWTGFLKEKGGTVSTRTNARPLSPAEQIKVIRVGVCLLCHLPTKKNIRRIYSDFPAALERIGPLCLTVETSASGHPH